MNSILKLSGFNISSGNICCGPDSFLFNLPRLAIAAVIATIFFIILALWPPALGAYTIEKRDEPATGQLVISPTKVELDANPGETVSRDITVANRTEQTATIRFSLEDFEGSNNPSQATVFMGEDDSDRGARRWLSPEVSSIVLKQGEAITFRVKVSIPRNSEPGGYYAALFADSTSEIEGEPVPAADIPTRVNCLFLIRVSGNVREEGSLKNLEVPYLSEYGPVDLGLVFNNLGNVHLKPSGRIIITNLLGQTVAEIPVKEWVVLPEASRRTVVQWEGNFLLGRYTARAEIDYGPGDNKLTVSRSFWVIPWKIVLAGLATLLALLLLIIKVSRKKRRAGSGPESGGAGPAATETAEQAISPGETPAPEQGKETLSTHVALNEIFPSMDDTQVVDLTDADTIRLIRSLISSGLDLARGYMSEGKTGDARRELEEAKSAAQRIGLLSEVGVIDGMLRTLGPGHS